MPQLPEFSEPEAFEGTLTEQQIEGLDKGQLKTALMLSQLSQAGDFAISWTRILAEHSRKQDSELEAIQLKLAALESEIARLRWVVQLAQWLAGVCCAAALVEIVRRIMKAGA